ncbi:MAG: hemin uptake protein HemP [Betaproteobacteria bacterium]|nr:hemin uptake protein HemP [Betaproteobacteria bacterium]
MTCPATIRPIAPSAAPPAERPPLQSRALLGEASVVTIEHAGQRYVLRVTRENKLILTK